jgi:threonine/homoserine/homoserine lactone efflux protein
LKLAAFVAASLVLAITPGPGVLFIVARTLAEGRRAGLAAVAGVAAGNLANAVAASLGLAALLALWPPGFTLMRIGGGAYLIALGLLALRAPADPAPPAAGRQAFWVALLNPKTMIFFAALLPPFLDPARPISSSPPSPQRSRPCTPTTAASATASGRSVGR